MVGIKSDENDHDLWLMTSKLCHHNWLGRYQEAWKYPDTIISLLCVLSVSEGLDSDELVSQTRILEVELHLENFTLGIFDY